MHPVLVRVGGLEITTFGVMVALGALLGIALLRRELRRSGIDPGKGADVGFWALAAGLLGAKLLYVAEHHDEGVAATLLARGGLSWFGGLVGGLLGGSIAIWRRRLPLLAVLAAAAPALALGQAVGRIGCFLVGDDYGRPTELPWGVAFPEGLPPTAQPVHPTQLYEALPLFVLAALLVRWRRRAPDGVVFAAYLALAGGLRFGIEFLRVNQPVAFGWSLAHFVSLAVLGAGLSLLAYTHWSQSKPRKTEAT